jgi:superfamily II DNA or RNA helicase
MTKTNTKIETDTMSVPSSSRRVLRPAAAVLALSATLFLGACASKGPPPVDAMATARAAITQAEAAQAGQLAPVELLAARDKLVQADAAVRAEEFARARRLAEQSAADATLAERMSRAARARQAAAELDRANAALKNEATNRAPR